MSSEEALSIALGVAILFVCIAAAVHVQGKPLGGQELASAQMDVLPMMSHVGDLTDLTPVDAY